jgi:hypothetical protein
VTVLARGGRYAAAVVIAVGVAAASADAAQGPLRADGAYWVDSGRLIAFPGYYGRGWDNARLWVMSADGSGRRRLVATGVLSPSGRLVADSFDTGSSGIVWVGGANGKNTQIL